MTKAEWLVEVDPKPMLTFLKSQAGHRKLCLLTAACSWRIWNLLPAQSQTAALVLELFADGLVSVDEYRNAWSNGDVAARACAQDPPDAHTYAAESVLISSPPTCVSVEYALSTASIAAGCHAAEQVADTEYDQVVEQVRLQEATVQSQLLRDIFGNPFRPVSFAPALRTSTAVAIAKGMYESRDFSAMPILADSLQDAGCDNDDVLEHCRDEKGTHVRGCWVVDLVLGKA